MMLWLVRTPMVAEIASRTWIYSRVRFPPPPFIFVAELLTSNQTREIRWVRTEVRTTPPVDTSKFVRLAVDWLLRSDIGEVIKTIVDDKAFPDYRTPKRAAGRKKAKRWTPLGVSTRVRRIVGRCLNPDIGPETWLILISWAYPASYHVNASSEDPGEKCLRLTQLHLLTRQSKLDKWAKKMEAALRRKCQSRLLPCPQ